MTAFIKKQADKLADQPKIVPLMHDCAAIINKEKTITLPNRNIIKTKKVKPGLEYTKACLRFSPESEQKPDMIMFAWKIRQKL